MPLSTVDSTALRAKGLGVDGQLIGEVGLQNLLQLLLLGGVRLGRSSGIRSRPTYSICLPNSL